MNGIAASGYVRLAAFTEHERSIMLAENDPPRLVPCNGERHCGDYGTKYLKTIVQWKEVRDESRNSFGERTRESIRVLVFKSSS